MRGPDAWGAGRDQAAGHWSFQRLAAPAVPAVRDAQWGRNTIDAFVLHRLEERGLRPAPPAEKAALLRRAYYDLAGLPPTPDEVQAFLADDSPLAFERVVDRLLDSPHYGERWARHWLDLVRFAETNSFERDRDKPNAWRYRDYVIRSLNDDKPFDRFVREQLAGDELPDGGEDGIIATGYYRLGLWDDEPADRLLARYNELDDIVTTTGQVFLGLTINCGRCHDHKIEPISQEDYYKFVAFFQDIGSYDYAGKFSQTDISPPDLKQAYAERDEALARLREQMSALEQAGVKKMPGEDQRKAETPQRAKLLAEKLKDYLSGEEFAEYEKLKEKFEALETEKLPPRRMALSVNHCSPVPPETYVLLRGNPRSRGPKVQPGFPHVLAGATEAIESEQATDSAAVTPPEHGRSSGRRLALANWIASPKNPLTARVIVNRVWQYHFGRGLVRSPNDFGTGGERPTHPELLDWLAGEFIRGGCKLKPLHRLIMTSSAYRMASRGAAAGREKDPANDLFWRFDMRRLTAEEIRDSMHAVNGRLNCEMYGPGIYPTISREVLAGQSMPGAGWGKSPPEQRARRSIYVHVKRSLITPMLASFDFPETDSSCPVRFATVQPTQALGMLNGEFVNEQAGAFAERLRREAGDDPRAQVQRALWLALSRPPQEREVQRGVALMRSLEQDDGLDAGSALKYYCLVVLNLNEFVYLD
jgi:hypothetical protein